jgi:uncharacterized protein HemY
MTYKTLIIAFACILMALLAVCSAQVTADKPPQVHWTGHASNGDIVAVPDKDAVTVLLFAMGDQSRSKDAVGELEKVLEGKQQVRVAVILSGAAATDGARQLQTSTKETWPTVADLDYAAAGVFGVHVWPTTVLVATDGNIVGHVAGLPKNYRTEVEAHLAFAQGKIDRDELERQVDGHATIADDPDQMACRHLIVAQRLLEKGLAQQARGECEAAQALHPQSPPALLALTGVLLRLGNTEGADKALNCVDARSVSPAVLNLLRGEIFEAQGKWDAAAKVLTEAVKLNPQPAEAWYHLGKAYDHLNDPAKAADAYRKAFEATDLGRRLRPS